jgi:hypothetical protein
MRADISTSTDSPNFCPNALAEHDKKARLLNDLAILLGCDGGLHSGFPDGRRPDVVRIDVVRQILFIGDAKQTETPRCEMTRIRLRNYLRWLRAHVCDAERLGIFALCFEKRSHRKGWSQTIIDTAALVGLQTHRHGFCSFGERLNMVWAVLVL